MGTRMRGLNQFIAEIRNCPNKDTEQKKVEKEMAKIRQKFVGNRALEGYHKKKYIWKLLYMLILGYDVDFGHLEAATLITAGRFSEKYTGYIALSLMVNEKDNEIFMRIGQSVRNDLLSNNEVNQSMAVSMIGTLAPKELVDVMAKDIEKIALSDTVRMPLFIRKKACLCLLRIFRKYREIFHTDGWSRDIFGMLDQKNLGFISSVVSLLYGVAVLNPHPNFEECVPKLIAILQKLVLQRDCTPDYLYYKTPNPWLVVKLLKTLQLFPPPERNSSLSSISEVLLKVVTKTEVTKNVNKNNTDHGILFECINLIVHYRNALHSDLRNQAISLLGVFVSVREPNIRYLALEAISKFSDTPHAENLIKEHLKTILKLLRDNDVSIRRRALDILYIMCTPSTAHKIVNELLNYSDEPDLSIKEELVLKIAILAEKFADDLFWYIDVVVRLISNSGDYITEDIWFRIIQIITGFGKDQNPELQKYAANKLYSALSIPNVHENLVKVGAYVLAEYGHLIVNQPGKDAYKIYETLNKHWITCNTGGKSMLLNAYVKLANTFPDLKYEILTALEINSEHWDPEIQQRAVEYLQLLKEDQQVEPIRQYVLQKMPAYSEEIQNNNPLLRRIYALKTGGVKSKDPTILNEVKKAAEEEVFKSRAYMTSSSLSKDLSSIGKETATIGGGPGPQRSSPPKPSTVSNVQTNLLGDDDLLDTSSSSAGGNISDHPLYKYCKDKLATGSNVIPVPNKLNLPQSNPQEFKNLLSNANGVLYQDNHVTVNYKSRYQGATGNIAIQLVSKGVPLSNVVISIPNTSNLFFNISPVQYADSPSVMIQVLNTAVGAEIPMVNLNFYQGESYRNVNFGLPIQANKWISGVNMPQQAIEKYYIDYTTANNDNYWRLDSFIKNPASSNVPLTEVMKKVASLLGGALGLTTTCLPDDNNVVIVNGVGQYVLQAEGSANPSNLPMIVQVECFEQNKEYLRLSLRGAANKEALKNLHQLVTLYMNV